MDTLEDSFYLVTFAKNISLCRPKLLTTVSSFNLQFLSLFSLIQVLSPFIKFPFYSVS